MSEPKERRQRALAELIGEHALASQEELAERLAELGYAVTQATISRDLEQIGAVKVRRPGGMSYALPDEASGATPPRLTAVFREFVRSIDTAGNLIVLRTPPGSAHLVGVALDRSSLAEVVGTICGDDTVFIACRAPAVADSLAMRLREAPSGELQ